MTVLKHQEIILAIPASLANSKIPEGEKFMGLMPVEFSSEDVHKDVRFNLETNPEWRQLISYAYAKYKNRYAVYRRTVKGNESRLHGQVSIGFGGHHDDVDSTSVNGLIDVDSTLEKAMRREIEEELDLNGSSILSFSILNDRIVSNATDVDAVHIGIVGCIELDSDVAKSGENQLDFIGFKTLEEIKAMDDKENWTTVLVEYLLSQE